MLTLDATRTLIKRIADLCWRNGLPITSQGCDRITYGEGWVCCTVNAIDDATNVILVDEVDAPC